MAAASRASWKRLSAGVISVIVVLGLLVVADLMYVHSKTWEWRLTPSATPLLVTFSDRDYRKAAGQTAGAVTGQPAGRTFGGGVIYAEKSPQGTVPTVIQVRSGRRVVEYALMGGP
jgi:hypothetical protein